MSKITCLNGEEAFDVLLAAANRTPQWRSIFKEWSNLYTLWSQEKGYSRATLLYDAMKRLKL